MLKTRKNQDSTTILNIVTGNSVLLAENVVSKLQRILFWGGV
jgi:hypothetical protein